MIKNNNRISDDLTTRGKAAARGSDHADAVGDRREVTRTDVVAVVVLAQYVHKVQ